MWLSKVLKSTLPLGFCSDSRKGKEVVETSAVLAKLGLLIDFKLMLAKSWDMLQLIGTQATAKG